MGVAAQELAATFQAYWQSWAIPFVQRGIEAATLVLPNDARSIGAGDVICKCPSHLSLSHGLRRTQIVTPGREATSNTPPV